MTSFEILINPRSPTEVRSIPDDKRIEDIKINNSKQQSYQNATFQLIDEDKTFYNDVSIGSAIEIEVNDVLEFTGFISNIAKNFVGGITLNIQCTGDTFDLERYLTAVNKTYTGEKSAAIAHNLCTSYGQGKLDISNINTNDGVTIQSIVFNAETLNTCFQRLSQLDGFNYYIGRARVSV